MKVDFHSHILPYMDDGSRDAEMTSKMLKMEKRSGVLLTALTSHYYESEESVGEFLKRREGAFSALMEVYNEKEMPSIILGAEVEMYKGMSDDDLSGLCLGDTNLLLCEMPSSFDDYISDELSELVCRGFVPLVAHFERYFPVYKEKEISEIADVEGCIYQINIMVLMVI